ncbi:MAG: hypothetical protein IKX03_03560 [Bacteroidales bacterium]|nr:hypothetical protein [Bacteroidales bacterium]
MKLKIRTLCTSAVIVAATLFFSGCLKDPEYPIIDGPYIQMYYDGVLDCQMTYVDDRGPCLYFDLTSSDDISIVSYNSASQGDKKAVYDSLCIKHSDTGYHGPDPFSNEPVKKCYAKDFTSISVVSNKAFDADHPAGTPLNDIIVYDAYSPYRWIKSGYDGDPYFYHARVLLSGVAPEDMTQLCALSMFTLSFWKFPDFGYEQTLTITVTTDDGVVHEFEKEVYF